MAEQEQAGSLLEVSDLSKTFRVARGSGGGGRLRALDSVSLRLARGETLGLVGESGCGKSTLARTLLRLERPDGGSVRFDGVDPFRLKGKELLAWRRRIQMVFQDPFASLNARMTAAEIISEPWTAHKDLYPAPRERDARVRELLELVGLRASDAARHPQEFSGGQRQRIGIARALALDPDVIVCDEPVSALDLSVQAQVVNLLADLQRRLSVSYLFISHDLSVVRHVADRVAVMYLGRIVETGRTGQVLDRPLHPYTAALTAAAPVLDVSGERTARRTLLQGEIPSPTDPPSGCRFRTRCDRAQDLCVEQVPVHGSGSGTSGAGRSGTARREEEPDGAEHSAACHFPLGPPGGAGADAGAGAGAGAGDSARAGASGEGTADGTGVTTRP